MLAWGVGAGPGPCAVVTCKQPATVMSAVNRRSGSLEETTSGRTRAAKERCSGLKSPRATGLTTRLRQTSFCLRTKELGVVSSVALGQCAAQTAVWKASRMGEGEMMDQTWCIGVSTHMGMATPELVARGPASHRPGVQSRIGSAPPDAVRVKPGRRSTPSTSRRRVQLTVTSATCAAASATPSRARGLRLSSIPTLKPVGTFFELGSAVG
jgi:hypothetical protein